MKSLWAAKHVRGVESVDRSFREPADSLQEGAVAKGVRFFYHDQLRPVIVAVNSDITSGIGIAVDLHLKLTHLA